MEIDHYHWHEALDRTYLCGEFIEEHLLTHPVIHTTPEFRQSVLDVVDALQQLYQAIPNHKNYLTR